MRTIITNNSTLISFAVYPINFVCWQIYLLHEEWIKSPYEELESFIN